MRRQINLLIIEPNVLIRKTLYNFFSDLIGVQVIGRVHDAQIALSKSYSIFPDLIIFDASSDQDNEIDALKNLLSDLFIPVIFFSNMCEDEVAKSVARLGCIDWSIVKKPTTDIENGTILILPQLKKVLKQLHLRSTMRLENFKPTVNSTNKCFPTTSTVKPDMKRQNHRTLSANSPNLIAIGASTGGASALLKILSSLPTHMPGIVVVIHMPANFTSSFADRLNKLCDIKVLEARGDLEIMAGQAIIAPGNRHVRVKKNGNNLYIELGSSDPVGGFCPSVDVLFKSVAVNVGDASSGVILTGMGRDGTEGMGQIMHYGGLTIAQDRSSSAVYGMPKSAIAAGFAREVIPLNKIAKRLIKEFPI